MDPGDGLLERLVVAAHQAAGDLEVPGLGVLAGLEDPPHARGIDAERFFHEHMTALGHGVLDVDRAEGRRRGQKHDASRGHAIDGLPVGVHAQELAGGGHLELRRVLRVELVEAALEPVLEDVGHGDQPGRARGAQGLGGRAGASAAASDQGNGDGLLLARVAPRGGGAGQGRAGRRGAGRGPRNSRLEDEETDWVWGRDCMGILQC